MNASGRLNTCKSSGRGVFEFLESGARVSNAYAIYLTHWDSPGKLGLIPDGLTVLHGTVSKELLVRDERAYY